MHEGTGAFVGWNLSRGKQSGSGQRASCCPPVPTGSQVLVPREERRSDLGRGDALAIAHAQSGERPPGLQLPEEPAAGRRRRDAGAILKSDP